MKIKYTLDEIDLVAKRLLKKFKNKVIIFNGEVGSGKTTLIRSIVNELGTYDKISSPTFSIVNEYKVLNGIVYHFDFYRINNHNEALDIGIYEYLNSENWNFIEWADKIQVLLPKNLIKINLSVISHQKRELEFLEIDSDSEMKKK
ncbi:MAG: tRNA (adenosine(37)-N6)-threonylcarbamoyltransferase complex ATPase subunit type 1 TsaE [Flavobacteriaceae bacterium]|nr:tRNA (adenosine(37)-N6)-threonylcarbamoyltransferase complex ATPase subunit type 1 TsaE [Flavobacteriaceae bacterium]|tara:strand:- start:49635 stop:50072 length:438 start_codon:yes stop_codon:yes gene_type:complete